MSVAGQLVREGRIARATGTEVELVDAEHPECSDFKAEEGGRWVTVCVDHGGFVQHETWKLARAHLGHPEDWCPTCQEETPATVNSRGGFSEQERERGLETRRKKAAEREARREAAREQEAVDRSLEGQWTDWTVSQPTVDRLYLDEEKKAHEAEAAVIVEAREAARKATQGRRAAERVIDDMPRPKSRKEKANLKRLETEAAELDQIVIEQTDRAQVAGVERDRLARRAYIRGCFAAGWVITSTSGVHRLEKADRKLRVPDDFLAGADYLEAQKMPEGHDG